MKKLLLFCGLLLSTYSYTQNTDRPKVFIITTGGTIASQTNAPLVEGQELIQAIFDKY